MAPKFLAEIPHYVQPTGQEQMVKLNGLRHLTSLTMKVYRTKLRGNHNLSINYHDDYKKIMDGAVEVPEAFQKRTFPCLCGL